MKSFREKILHNMKERDALLCVGLDPRIKAEETNTKKLSICDSIVAENQRVIRETEHVCACYKPNIAFYECWGAEGLEALWKTMAIIPPEIPVVLDVKKSDIGSTAEAYARAAFEHFNVDAVTLSPYMGRESIEPFLSYDEAFLFILVRTSNPGSDVFQMMPVHGQPLYQHIAEESVKWASPQRLGFVIGATASSALAHMRDTHPKHLLLCPGIGAQGGSIITCMQHGLNKDADNVLPVISRSIANAEDTRSAAEEYNEQAREASATHKWPFEKVKHAQTNSTSMPSLGTKLQTKPSEAARLKEKNALIDDLLHTKCFKIGSFTLKSGVHSPFYIDLRRIVSFPALMKRVVQAYTALLSSLSFDCIAGIPTAGLPFAAALAYTQGLPMIYPRIPKKPHGTGNAIEGHYKAGQRVVLLDDLITYGTSKHEAVEILRGAHLEVSNLVVFVRRSQKADEDMRECGITLHYILDIMDIIERGKHTQLLSKQAYKEAHAFVLQ